MTIDPDFACRAEERRSGRWVVRKVQGPAHGRDFDRNFWKRAGVSAIMNAAWEMVLGRVRL